MAAPHSPPQSPPAARLAFVSVDSHDHIPYSQVFSDEVSRTVLDPGTYGVITGQHIYGPSSKGKPKQNSVNLRDIDLALLPHIDPSELPLSLDDPRRTFASIIPGILTTHPGGWLEGSAPHGETPYHTCEKDAEAALDFIKKNDIKNPTDYQKRIKFELTRQFHDLEERMRERQKLMDENERIDGDIKELEEKREIERKIERNIRAGAKRRKMS